MSINLWEPVGFVSCLFGGAENGIYMDILPPSQPNPSPTVPAWPVGIEGRRQQGPLRDTHEAHTEETLLLLVLQRNPQGMPSYRDGNTVDGRNPAPVDRWFIPVFIGFQPSKGVQDIFHPRCLWVLITPHNFAAWRPWMFSWVFPASCSKCPPVAGARPGHKEDVSRQKMELRWFKMIENHLRWEL